MTSLYDDSSSSDDGEYSSSMFAKKTTTTLLAKKHKSEESELPYNTLSLSKSNPSASIDCCASSDDEDDDNGDNDLLLKGGPVFSKSSNRPKKPLLASSSMSSSSSSSTRSTTTTPARSSTSQQQQKQREREENKRKRQEEREREKEERKAQRLATKVAKQQEQQQNKAEKQKRLDQAKQAMGKFATNEIAVLIHPKFLVTTQKYDEAEELMESFQQTYSVQPYESIDNSFQTNSGGIPIQWIRKDYLKGGATDALQGLQRKEFHRYQHLHSLVIVFDDAPKFLKLLHRKHEDDDYPLLQQYLQQLLTQWRLHWNLSHTDTPRVFFLLHQVADEVNRQWNAHAKSKDKQSSTSSAAAAPVSDAELHDAICFLLVQHHVECLLYDTMEKIVEFLTKMTRALSEEPYQQQVTELECIKKIKADDTLNDQDLFEKAKDCWVRQLQQLPRMSENYALNLAHHYATPRQLWDAYQDPNLTEGEKRGLVSSLLQNGRENRKLSDTLYRFMTSMDVQELL